MFFKKKITDEAIIEGLKTGNSDWNSITYKHFKPILERFYRKGKNRQQQDEMVFNAAYNQTIFALMQNVRSGKYRATAKLSTYLIDIFKKKLIDELRRFNKNTAHPENDVSTFYDLPSTLNIEKEFQTKETLAIAIEVLKNIGDNCYEVIMKHIEGFKDKEIAELLGLATAKVVKSRRHTCKKKFNEVIALKLENYAL